MNEQPTIEQADPVTEAVERLQFRFPGWTIQPSDVVPRWWARNSGDLTYPEMLRGCERLVDADTLDELGAELDRQENLRSGR